jgi:undecaprenyl-diphosphatase
MLTALLADFARLVFFVACAAVLLRASARRGRTGWASRLTERHVAVLGLLTLAVVGAEVFEDVLAGESGPLDTTLLWFVREHVPLALTGIFAAVTRSGSVAFLLPATATCVIVLLVARRRFEALLLAASTSTATLLIYTIKTSVGRVRPALWETQWYSGSSVPSGHTLATAAFATAGAFASRGCGWARAAPQWPSPAVDCAGWFVTARTGRALAFGRARRDMCWGVRAAGLQRGFRSSRHTLDLLALLFVSAQMAQAQSRTLPPCHLFRAPGRPGNRHFPSCALR